jgi:hypothetical protein
MHLHVSRVVRGGRTYQYGQLVQSFRRPDGMPSQRVLASLGLVSELEVQNLRAALQASRRGESVVIATTRLPKGARAPRVAQSLRYLDAAVLIELWREYGLAALVERLLPQGASEVAAADVVASLVIQRCIDPGSKLYAERWFPRTALPELLGIAPIRFNNTRVHRVLEQLDEVTPRLMDALPTLYEQQHGSCSALFLDITDTWFVGEGPDLAEMGKTKEGLVQQKVGIVLLCNERGLPMRWHVIGGKRPEPSAMHALLGEVRGLGWLGSAPVVMDRAMGASADLSKMLVHGLRFVTMLRSTEFGSYTRAIPYEPLADLQPATGHVESGEDPCIAEAARRVAAAGMQSVSPTLYVLDLGVVERDAPVEVERADAELDPAARALRLALEIQSLVQSGASDSFNSAARKLGLNPIVGKSYRTLLHLDRSIQQDLLEGRLKGLSVKRLIEFAQRRPNADEQRRALESLRARRRRPSREARDLVNDEVAEPVAPVRVRAVVTFNPEYFEQERRTAQHQLDEIQTYVRDLNLRLARPRARRTAESIKGELDRFLRTRSLLECFHVHVASKTSANGVEHLFVSVELDPDEWTRRRRYDGFGVVVAHPEIVLPAADLARLYRKRDVVEAAFRVIKSVVKLRPVRHFTDAKVRAHVTLCVLALLLERMLEHRMTDSSAARALELLRSCSLNRFHAEPGASAYVVTTPDEEQAAILRRLRMQHLADEARVAESLRPR